jgi:N-acetylglucosaminyl-diphospho-decaprenol L-rhamnosyltransferase
MSKTSAYDNSAGHPRGSPPAPELILLPPGTPTAVDLSVVVVTYRSARHIASCLEAALVATKNLSAELIVVDNASDDDTLAVVHQADPGAKVVAMDSNAGFARGCHAGAAVAGGRWLLFLNPDAVVSPEAVDALVDCVRRHPESGVVGGRCVTVDGQTDPRSWWGRPTPWSALCFALGLSTLLPGNRIFDSESPREFRSGGLTEHNVPIVTGACMLVDRDIWDEAGGFDQAFFMYGEDADFCLRLRGRCRPIVTSAATYLHVGGASSTSERKLLLLFTGKATLVREHFPRGLRSAGVRLLLLGVLLRALASRALPVIAAERQGRPTTHGQSWRALWKARREWTSGWPGDSSLATTEK